FPPSPGQWQRLLFRFRNVGIATRYHAGRQPDVDCDRVVEAGKEFLWVDIRQWGDCPPTYGVSGVNIPAFIFLGTAIFDRQLLGMLDRDSKTPLDVGTDLVR